jgi:hypothetical protein
MRIVFEYPRMLEDLVKAETFLRSVLEKLDRTIRKEEAEARDDSTPRISEAASFESQLGK